MKVLTLVQMKENQKGAVAALEGGSAFVRRMMSMGIFPGREVTKLSQFALRGPVMLKVSRATIAVGHAMASRIKVRVE